MKIAVIDLETDPFEYKRMIHPFVAGFYDGHTWAYRWGPHCVAQIVNFLIEQPEPLTIFAHNGGRFDYFYFMRYLHKELRIVNNRLIQAWIGKHELRDSFAIMPFALESYKKTPIDYQKFKADVREKHREEITAYLKDDCTDLYTLCSRFNQEFGSALTIGSASIKQLKKFHSFARGNEVFDEKFRKSFYFGGRNQVFKTGHIAGPINVYDVNSMYPFVMRDYLHPVSTGIIRGNKIDINTAFVSVEGYNYGAFPVRCKDNSLDFTSPYGTYHTTIHEFIASQETCTFRPVKILKTLGFTRRESFEEFVSHFYNARLKAKLDGDKILTLFYKFVLNSGYGKFAQNPENYHDWYITEPDEFPPDWHECDGTCDRVKCRLKWVPSFIGAEDYMIWKRPLRELNYNNIATGASITGAARAVLLRGLAAATDPYYCDTDSIICRSLDGVPLSETELGAWKLEATGTHAAICGKKLYAVYDGSECIKKAHKGARLTGEEILRIANGETVESCNPVPSFKFNGTFSFTKRSIRKTGVEKVKAF